MTDLQRHPTKNQLIMISTNTFLTLKKIKYFNAIEKKILSNLPTYFK
jgi:hypothetical protein